jgi:hypothetical protein
MGTQNYPGSNEDDLYALDALAVQGLPTEEAMNLFEGRTPRPVAEKAYKDFLAYHNKPIA